MQKEGFQVSLQSEPSYTFIPVTDRGEHGTQARQILQITIGWFLFCIPAPWAPPSSVLESRKVACKGRPSADQGTLKRSLPLKSSLSPGDPSCSRRLSVLSHMGYSLLFTCIVARNDQQVTEMHRKIRSVEQVLLPDSPEPSEEQVVACGRASNVLSSDLNLSHPCIDPHSDTTRTPVLKPSSQGAPDNRHRQLLLPSLSGAILPHGLM